MQIEYLHGVDNVVGYEELGKLLSNLSRFYFCTESVDSLHLVYVTMDGIKYTLQLSRVKGTHASAVILKGDVPVWKTEPFLLEPVQLAKYYRQMCDQVQIIHYTNR